MKWRALLAWYWPSLLLALLFLPFKLFGLEVSYLNIHAARDWERGWQMLHGEMLWWHGPELSFRGTTPGFFFNVLTGIFQIPDRNPFFAAAGPAILFCGAIFFFHDAIRRLFCGRIALFSALFFGLFPLGTVTLRYVWNPSYLFLFTAFALWCFTRGVMEKRRGFIAAAFVALLLEGQIHISAYQALAGLAIAAAVLRVFPTWRQLLLVIAVNAVFIVPYFFYQAANNWPDGAAQALARTINTEDVSRIAPNPKFWQPFFMQFVHQPPLDRIGMTQHFPFSYFERFYQARAQNATLGMIVFLLSIIPALFVVAGAVRLVLPQRIARFASPQRRVLFGCVLAIIPVAAPLLVWNPYTFMDFPVPVRYFQAVWPAQFFLFAAGLAWLQRRIPFLAARIVLVPVFISFFWITVVFHREAQRTGEPFNYLTIATWPVHALRDKVALAEYLRTKYGLTEDLLLSNVHTEGKLLVFTEESLDYEVRAAVEHHPDAPAADPNVYFFLYTDQYADRIAGEFEEIERKTFGGIHLLVYRPLGDISGWEPDAPVSWWWY